MPTSVPPLLPSSGKEWRLRSLNRGDREALFRLLASEGWVVPAQDQESVLSWVVQQAWRIARERIKAFPAVNDVTGEPALPDTREEA